MPKERPDQLALTLKKIEARAKERSKAREKQEQPEDAPKPPAKRRSRKPHPGAPTAKVLAAASQRIESFLRESGIEQFDLFPANEVPTPFTRLPLFPPVQRKTAQGQITGDWLALHSRWDKGGVYKAGPALTVYDEDTLIGLMNLRTQGLVGSPDRLPIRTPSEMSDPSSTVRVHSLFCLISQLETTVQGRTPQKGWGGRAIQKRRESIDRLSAVTLRFEQPHGAEALRGKSIQLLHVEYVTTDKEACYYVQFHPLVTQWLETYRTYIDFELRRKLTPLGKALHRFLASQKSNKTYTIELATLFEAVGAHGELRDLKRMALVQLERLKNEAFLVSYEVTGTGKSKPWRLNVCFSER